MSVLNTVLVLAVIATVIVLGMGIVSMARGGRYDRQHSVQLMATRVGLQAATLLFLLVALLLTT